jgi:hypothetical protein
MKAFAYPSTVPAESVIGEYFPGAYFYNGYPIDVPLSS